MKLSRREMLGFSASLLSTMIAPVWAQPGKNADGKRIVRIAASALSNNGTLSTLREQSNVGRRILPSFLEPVIATDVLGDHHMLGKLGYFDQSYHIPMIVRDPRPTADASRGKIVRDFTETIDTMPTILEWMGLPVPRSCDGASLLPFLAQGQAPQGWRTEVHYEFDFRNIFYSTPEEHMGTGLDDSSLSVVQDHNYKYVHFTNAAPLFFDLKADPAQLNNLANDPAQQHTMLRYAQKMLSWRMRYMDRTLTAYAASPEGLLKRA